jgi:stearoyl-CoA desaturase (delta-9 desaturase)
VALLTWGEGWHNNHHAHPRAARHGLRWYEIDMNWYGIRALTLLGLAKDIKLINVAGQAKTAAVSERAQLKAAA